jgi:hypothetical protein
MKAKKDSLVGHARENFEPVAVLLITGKNYRALEQKSREIHEQLKVIVA